jgi:hypothetical protein
MDDKPVATEGMSTRATALEAGLATMRLDSNDEDSDDDLSEADEDLTSQGTDDTQVVSDLHVQGMAVFDSTRCLVELSQKVKGHALPCGHLCVSCPRPKHTVLQTQAGRRGQEGYYQELPNAKGTSHDNVADTYVSHQAWIESRQSNRAVLTMLGQDQSPGKAALDSSSLKARSAPVVRIDTTPKGPRATQLQTWATVLPATPMATATAPLLVPTTPIAPLKPALSVLTTTPTLKPAPPMVQPPPTPTIVPPVAPSTAPPPPTILPQPAVTPGVLVQSVPIVVQPSVQEIAKPAPTVPTTQVPPPASDPAMVLLLTRLVDNVDALNKSHQTVLSTNEKMIL